MWSKTSLEEGPISQKLRENPHSIFHRPWYLGPSTLPILYYFVFDVYFVTLMNGSLIIIGSKFEMWLLIYTAHQNTKIAKIQTSRFHFQGEYPPPPHKLLHMGHNVVKNILRRGSHFKKKLRENTHSIFTGPDTSHHNAHPTPIGQHGKVFDKRKMKRCQQINLHRP